MFIPLAGTTIGLLLFYVVGKAMNVVVNGYLLQVELATGALGLIVGYAIASLAAPQPKAENAKNDSA